MKHASKKIQIMLLAIIIIGTVATCDWGKSTTIVTKTDKLTQRIKYSGKVIFNEKQDGIERILNGGYLEFERNDRSFKAKDNGQGKISYEFDGDRAVTKLDDEQKEFVAQAVTQIVKARGKLKK